MCLIAERSVEWRRSSEFKPNARGFLNQLERRDYS